MFVIEALTVGGAEQMVVDIANELSSQGDDVHVVCLTSRGELADSLAGTVSLHVLDKKPGVDLSIAHKLRKLVKYLSIDVVNSHLWTANLWTRIALYRSGVPVVVTEHNRDIWKGIHNRVIDRILAYSTARLIAVSNDTARFYSQSVRVPERLIVVINNGVDTARYASGRSTSLRDDFATPNEFLIGTVGRLASAKNHSRLVEASAMLRDQSIAFKVIIAGEGPERDTTQSRINTLQLEDCVTLLGERKDIPDILAALDVFVLSSDREGHPLSALEAQSAGTPVVLTRAGGSADAISQSDSGFGGILVEPSASAIADCLLDLYSDREKLARMSVFAKNYAAQHYDKSSMIKKYSDLFNHVQQQPQ